MFDPCWGLALIGTDKTLSHKSALLALSVRVADPFSPCC